MMVSIHNKHQKYDAIFLSPHLDDAVLSAGIEIAKLVAQGKKVLIVTFFTAAPIVPSADAQHFVLASDHTSGQALFAHRRDEDHLACQTLGASHIHLDLVDALFRVSVSGQAIYPNFLHLFSGKISADDQQLAADLQSIMLAILNKVARPNCTFYAPLGVGNHIDHCLVFNAVLSLTAPVVFWEDIPYQADTRSTVRRLAVLSKKKSLEYYKVVSSEVIHQQKQKAVLCYTSQIPGLAENGLSAIHYQQERFYR